MYLFPLLLRLCSHLLQNPKRRLQKKTLPNAGMSRVYGIVGMGKGGVHRVEMNEN